MYTNEHYRYEDTDYRDRIYNVILRRTEPTFDVAEHGVVCHPIGISFSRSCDHVGRYVLRW